MTKKKRLPSPTPLDYGTNELSKRFATKPERKASGVVYIRVQNGNQVDAYLFSGAITPDQHSVLTGFQVDLHRASLTGIKCATLEAKISITSHEISSSEAEHRGKINQAMTYIKKTRGPQVLSNLLVICLNDQPGSVPLLLIGVEALSEFRNPGRPTASR
jgi:hypothetical protein